MILTLSRQLGSEGDTIAARVAAALNLTLADHDYICRMALAAGVPPQPLQKLMYEGRYNLAGEILNSLGGEPPTLAGGAAPAPGPLEGIFTPMLIPPTISLEEAVRMIGLVIKDIARRDNVLLLGQGSQVFLRDFDGAFHVQVVAPFELRAARVAARQNLTLPAARRLVRANDRARAEYLARYHNIRWLDPLLYHLTINTGQTPPDAAVSIIVQAAQTLGRKA